MKFNSQICTSREQSERLLALGLKKETADCFLMLVGDLGGPELYTIRFGTPYDGWTEGVIPAWSLHRLMIFAATPLELEEMLGYNFYDYYDNAINHIESLIKEGYFNKEYLCEK